MLIYTINLWAVIGAAVATMILGMLWYSSVMFGKKWSELIGALEITQDSPHAKKSARLAYLCMMVSALVMAYILALFIENMFVPSMMGALTIALLAWLGFIATSMSGEYVFNSKPKPWMLYMINSGYYLAALLINAIIIFIFIK